MNNVPRPETGVMQFDDDWPGVFIRGDNAAYFAMCLRMVLAGTADPISRLQVEGLASLLEQSDVRTKPERQFARDCLGPCYCCRENGCYDGCGCTPVEPEEPEEKEPTST